MRYLTESLGTDIQLPTGDLLVTCPYSVSFRPPSSITSPRPELPGITSQSPTSAQTLVSGSAFVQKCPLPAPVPENLLYSSFLRVHSRL